MKNPFEKNDHRLLIAGITVGTVIAGGVAYLFLTETGGKVRKELTGHINRIMGSIMGGGPSNIGQEIAPNYLHHEHPKTPQSDIGSIKQHAAAINHQGGEGHPENENI